MTDLDELPFDYPSSPTPTGAGPRRHRHVWGPTKGVGRMHALVNADPAVAIVCVRCGATRDEARGRRGRNNRARGNRIELQMARELGMRKVGQYGGPEDATSAPFVAQVKSRSGAAFPGWMSDELAKLPVLASQTPILVVAEANPATRKRRALVVLTLDDWKALHG